MKLARYWTRDQGEAIDPSGNRIRVTARGWSDESLDAARARAREIAQRVAGRILSHPGQKNQYQYGDRPLPEPVIQKIGDSVVTRNAYGALVLNTGQLLFADIDREDGAGPVTDSVRRVAERHHLSARVYKTAGGYRVLVTNSNFRAGTDETEALLREFGSDPLYMRLCRIQESFRARLTPKPWRCDFRNPPVEFPFETPQAEAQFRTWETEYRSKSAPYATCRYLTAVGGDRVIPEFDPLIRYHDQETKASTDLPLA